MHQIDRDLLLFFNHTTAAHPYLMKLVRFLGDNPMGRGIPVFGTLTYLWFSPRDAETRSRIVVGFLATSLILAVSLLCQHVLAIHVRPIFDRSIDVINILQWDIDRFQKRHYSFPSDTAVLYFGLAATIFTINRRVGAANFIWCFFTVGLCRVALGVHYPSDIIAGIVISSLAVLLADHLPFLRRAVLGAMTAFDADDLIANTVFVLFVLEAYSVFPGVQAIFSNVMQLILSGA
jgi:undecaprenyl-diphosphatase